MTPKRADVSAVATARSEHVAEYTALLQEGELQAKLRDGIVRSHARLESRGGEHA